AADAGDAGAAAPVRPRTVDRRPAAAVPLLLEALQCYGVLERAHWDSALGGGFLGRPPVERGRRRAYEEVLWLGDDRVPRAQRRGAGRRGGGPRGGEKAPAGRARRRAPGFPRAGRDRPPADAGALCAACQLP